MAAATTNIINMFINSKIELEVVDTIFIQINQEDIFTTAI